MCDHLKVKCLHCGAEGSPAQLLASHSTEAKAAAARKNGKKGGRPAWTHAVVVNYECRLGERGAVVSRHSSYELAREAARRSGFDDFLAVRDRLDLSKEP